MKKIVKSIVACGAASALCLFALIGCSSGGNATTDASTESESVTSEAIETETDVQAVEKTESAAETNAQAIEDAEAEGRIVVTGTCRIYSGAKLAKMKDLDPQQILGTDGEDMTYAVVEFDSPTPLNVAFSGDMGNLREDNATMVCVAANEPEWDVIQGDMSLWKDYEGKTVTVSLVPEETWWPSDVRLPIGEPRTDTAELLFAE